jgi:hypothetical protein
MQTGRFIATDAAVFYLLGYYLFFWAVNTTAYAAIAFGIFRWWRFARGLALEEIMRRSFWITAGFGSARLLFGGLGVLLLLVGVLTRIETVFALGITSLCLNTSFILLEGIMLNREAGLLLEGTEDSRRLRREAMRQFESLRRTLKNA